MEAYKFALAVFALYHMAICVANAASTKAPITTKATSSTNAPNTNAPNQPTQTPPGTAAPYQPTQTPPGTTAPTQQTQAPPGTAAPHQPTFTPPGTTAPTQQTQAPSENSTGGTTTAANTAAEERVCPVGTYDAVKDHAIFLFAEQCEIHVMFTLPPSTTAPATNAPATSTPAPSGQEQEGTGGTGGETGGEMGGEMEGSSSMTMSNPNIMIKPVTTAGQEAGGECTITASEKLGTKGYLVDVNMCEFIAIMRTTRSGAVDPIMYSRPIKD